MAEHYQRPGWFTKQVFNRAVAGLTRLGVSVAGSRVLEVRGRKSGEWRRTPVNVLDFEGARYLVAPRGHTQWVEEPPLELGGSAARRPADRALPGGGDTGRAEGAAASRLSEAMEVGGRCLLWRRWARFQRRGAGPDRPRPPGLSRRGRGGELAGVAAARRHRAPSCSGPESSPEISWCTMGSFERKIVSASPLATMRPS